MSEAKISGTGQRDDEHYVTISGLTKEEGESLRGMMHGQWWAKCDDDGRIQFHPARETLPAPQDENMMPFWREYDHKAHGVQMPLIHLAEMPPHSSPSIMIQHLCGYSYTPEKYAEQVAILGSYGFECLRSRRGDDGEYWEIWYLCGLFDAEGGLKQAIETIKDEKKKLDIAISFLCRTASFGTLDVLIQRAAMQVEEDM